MDAEGCASARERVVTRVGAPVEHVVELALAPDRAVVELGQDGATAWRIEVSSTGPDGPWTALDRRDPNALLAVLPPVVDLGVGPAWLRVVTDAHPLQVVGPLEITRTAQPRRLELELRRGVTVRGRLSARRGDPGLWAVSLMQRRDGAWVVEPTKAFQPAHDGHFELRGLWAGEWGVSLERRTVVPAASFVVAAEDHELELDLEVTVPGAR